MSWSEAEVETLRRLWAEGKSQTLIGVILGRSRSMIAGKISRLRLPGRRTEERKNPDEYVRKRVAQQGVKARNLARKRVARVERIIDTLLTDGDCGAAEGLSGAPEAVMTLRPNQCRWPLGDGSGFHFCAADKESGSYCLEHAGRAYVKSREPEARPKVSPINFARY